MIFYKRAPIIIKNGLPHFIHFHNTQIYKICCHFTSGNQEIDLSNLWSNRHVLEDTELSDFFKTSIKNEDYTPEILHYLSISNKLDHNTLISKNWESYAISTLTSKESSKDYTQNIARLLYFFAETGLPVSDELYKKFSELRESDSRIEFALSLIKLTNFLKNSDQKIFLAPVGATCLDELGYNTTDLSYLNLISTLAPNAFCVLGPKFTSFLENVVFAYNFVINPPSSDRIERERNEAKECSILSEPLQIGIFYYTLVNVKLKEIYIRRQPNDYLDAKNEVLRPFILWKEAYAKAKGYKIVEY